MIAPAISNYSMLFGAVVSWGIMYVWFWKGGGSVMGDHVGGEGWGWCGGCVFAVWSWANACIQGEMYTPLIIPSNTHTYTYPSIYTQTCTYPHIPQYTHTYILQYKHTHTIFAHTHTGTHS